MDSSLVEETPEEYLGDMNAALNQLNITHQQQQQSYARKNLEKAGAFAETRSGTPPSCETEEIVQRRNSTVEENTQRKDVQSFESDEGKRNEMDISQTSNSGDDSPFEGTSVVRTKLPPGKV